MPFRINDPVLTLVAVAAVLGFAFAVIVMAMRVSRTRSRAEVWTAGSETGPEGGERPNWEALCSLVQERVETYRDQSLRYQLGLELHHRNASRESLLKLLAGREEVMAHPILYLNSGDWKWDQQQLQDAVTQTLKELDLTVPEDVGEPTAQAERACDDWAIAEARQQYDQMLGSDAHPG